MNSSAPVKFWRETGVPRPGILVVRASIHTEKDSLKATARCKGGKGIRRKVEANTQPPKNWASFLRIDENKVELFRFLSISVIDAAKTEMNIFCAFDEEVICTRDHNLTNLWPCTQEEGDTRAFMHIGDMVQNGLQKIKLRTVDTDVIVIALGLYEILALQELWVEFGTGKNKKFFDVNSLYQAIGPAKAKALLFFHVFTGCDKVSFFASCKKTKAWNTWIWFPAVTDTFTKLREAPTEEGVRSSMSMIERFTSLMFVKDGKDLETIPPTHGTLFQHTLRAAFMAGYVWCQTLVACPLLPPWRSG